MSITVNNSLSLSNITFKGKFDKSEKGSTYYKTNSGLVAGSCLAAIPAIALGLNLAKGKNKKTIPALGEMGYFIGCGAIVDYIRNKKAGEAADLVKQVGPNKALLQNDRLDLSRNNRTYYDSNIGSKYGALLSLPFGLGVSLLTLKQQKEAIKAMPEGIRGVYKVSSVIMSIGISALAGWIMGKIADSNANKDSRRHA